MKKSILFLALLVIVLSCGSKTREDIIKEKGAIKMVLKVDIPNDPDDEGLMNVFNVFRRRVEGMGITMATLVPHSEDHTIDVDLPGIMDEKRIRDMFSSDGNIEFWETFKYCEISSSLSDADAALGKYLGEKNPLLQLLHPVNQDNTACIGFAQAADTAILNRYFSMPVVIDKLPEEFRPMWCAKPFQVNETSELIELVALRISDMKTRKAPIDGTAITTAYVEDNQWGLSVSMEMNHDGAFAWASMTKDNIGRQIAMVLNGRVYSYPTVMSEIAGGRTQITGNYTKEEAEDMATVLRSGKLPIRAKILELEVIRPDRH